MRKLVLDSSGCSFAAATLSVYAADQKKTAPAAAPLTRT